MRNLFKIIPVFVGVVFSVGFFVARSANGKVETSVETSVSTVILKDSDGDNILDRDDAHPNTPEIYIVRDDNLNGIVDDFEASMGEKANE